MMTKKSKSRAKPGQSLEPSKAAAPDAVRVKCASIKEFSGSIDDDFSKMVILQTVNAGHYNSQHSPEQIATVRQGMAAALKEIAPQDAMEGMLAAQLVATHQAAMECYRRSMLEGATLEGRQMNLGQANKLSRTYAALLDTLNKHRGKGQQEVTVKHVTVNAGGQAIVGTVTHGGGGASKTGEQSHAVNAAVTYSPGETLRSQDTKREPVPVLGNAEER